MINTLGARGMPVVAVDIPSGVDAGTGTIASTTVAATHTIAFHSAKVGLVVPLAAKQRRDLVWEIGLPRHLEPECDVRVVATGQVRVPGRRSDDHKYRADTWPCWPGLPNTRALHFSRPARRCAPAPVMSSSGRGEVVAALPSVSVEITPPLWASPHLRDVERTMACVRPRISALAFGPGSVGSWIRPR